MSDFPFPLASYIHKCAVNNKCLYFTAHEIIWKKLKTKKTKFLKILRSIHVIQAIKQSYSIKSKNYNQKPIEGQSQRNIILFHSRAPWLSKSTHPKKFGNQVTVHRPSVRLHHRHTNVK